MASPLSTTRARSQCFCLSVAAQSCGGMGARLSPGLQSQQNHGRFSCRHRKGLKPSLCVVSGTRHPRQLSLSPAVLPQDGGTAAAAGLHAAAEGPLCRHHPVAPGTPPAGAAGPAGALSPHLGRGGGIQPSRVGAFSCFGVFFVCLCVFLYSRLSKAFLWRAALPVLAARAGRCGGGDCACAGEAGRGRSRGPTAAAEGL